MNPAFSVIMLTTASGAGYGMLFWLGVLSALGAMPVQTSFGVPAIFIALALATAGLIASTLHLGRPERAWRAISQWRTSWLSREGVVSLVTYLPALGFAAAWGIAGPHSIAAIVLGLLAALCGLLTVLCQAMIYASLKPVRQWHNGYAAPNLLLLGAASGAACLAAMATFWALAPGRVAGGIAVLLCLLALAAKIAYWRFIDRAPPVATIESATGLGFIGPVRQLEAPHTEENYLLREMGYRIGRKHGDRLRTIALAAGFVVPVVLLIVGMILGDPIAMILFPIAAAMTLLGVYVERWLFFAQATHTVTLYYGRTG
ncbi:MAG TPA: DmsC/YnfH family molybdoenzyme membrane anchor subunit [Acetobacteraceae bacterium]|nr:DmsC/YnfH family molybdoenzyme membrane anchor subunit [Acetobacteraceae bacterium]